jgi:hypothetical protein
MNPQNHNILNDSDRYIFTQALGDAMGYPKSDSNNISLGYSEQVLRDLHTKLLQDEKLQLNLEEKQIVLNCIDGALEYVGSDIPSLYDISELKLLEFKEALEKSWHMNSKYRNK